MYTGCPAEIAKNFWGHITGINNCNVGKRDRTSPVNAVLESVQEESKIASFEW